MPGFLDQPRQSAATDVPEPQQPTPGDGGAPIMEQQKRNWSLSPQQAPTAAKRLGKRVRRKVSSMSRTAVRRIRHPMAGGDAESECESSSGNEDSDAESPASEDAEVRLVRLRDRRQHPSNTARAAPAVPRATAAAGGRTLAVQVLMARGLPPANLNEAADPYCSVRCGSEEGVTASIFNTLEPRWSETFVFANPHITDETWPSNQRVMITVKNSNKHMADDCIGQAEASLAQFTSSPAPQWLDLERPKGSVAEKGQSCGQICVAMWHGPELEPQPEGHGLRPVVSTLDFPVGACKPLPSVIHSQNHALYEEPAAVYLDVSLRRLRISDANALLLPDQKSSRSKKHRQYNMPAQDPSMATLQHSTADGATPADQQGVEVAAQPTFEPQDDAASDATIAPDAESDDEDGEDTKGQGAPGMDFSSIADPFGDQDSGGGSRGKRSSRQHDRDEHGKGQRLQHGDNARPGHREKEEEDDDGGQTFLFLKVRLSEQQHKSSMKLLSTDTLRWGAHFPFVVTAPIRRQVVEVQLYRAVADRSRGRLVGGALIPLVDLMDSAAPVGEPGVEAARVSSKGMGAFEMHQGSKDGAVFGSVLLGLTAVDADDRRQLYRQPLLDLHDLTAGPQQSSLISARGGTSSAVELAAAVPRPLPFVVRPPLGTLSLTLSHIELAEPAHSFAVISCGPHWGLTPVIAETDEPWFNWQVRLPVHDVYTLFQLAVFRSGDPHGVAAVKQRIPFMKSKPLLLGKLRVRLSTVAPGKTWTVALPMLAGRRNGGEHTATAHLSMRVDYRSRKDQLACYTRPPMKKEAYTSAIASLANNKEMNIRGRDIVATWLEAVSPSMPASVANTMADNARDEFSLPRAHVNFRRCSEALSGFKRLGALYQHAESWKNPLLSIWMHVVAWLMCFRPTAFALLCIGGALYHAARRADAERGAPEPMDEDPTGLKSEGKDDDDDRQKSLSLKIKVKGKYDHLVEVCLNFSNGLDDVACFFERWQAAMNWSDPMATAVCVVALVLLGMASAIFGFPTVLFCILCIMLRHPALRSPTPPAPLNFFMRLPTRSDVIM